MFGFFKASDPERPAVRRVRTRTLTVTGATARFAARRAQESAQADARARRARRSR